MYFAHTNAQSPRYQLFPSLFAPVHRRPKRRLAIVNQRCLERNSSAASSIRRERSISSVYHLSLLPAIIPFLFFIVFHQVFRVLLKLCFFYMVHWYL